LGERLTKTWGQSVVIDNKPGGQNVIGAQAVARAAPDGYTFYFTTTAALVSNQFLFKSLGYDPQRDFTSVAFVANSPFGLFVKADSPLVSLQDLIAKSKANPSAISIANEGPRTFGGIIARLLNAKTQAQSNLVPYSSVGVAVQDVMGGHADAALVDLASSAQLVKQGRLRLLAVSSAKRVPSFDQVPSFSESLPGFEMVGWFALVAPTGAPAWVNDFVNGDNVGFSFSTPAAVAGLPHLTVPCGLVHGLPVAVSFVGAAWSEALLLRLGYAYEQASHARQAPKYLATLPLPQPLPGM
jgi:tripartite-type tricarboxylate transporter receptor subunit TctC